MNQKEINYFKHCPGTTLCDTKDFNRARKYINETTLKNGYGLIISNPIFVHKFPDGYQYRYIISNMIKTYTDEIILEPMFEWESYLEQMTIYDHSDIDFYEENFKNIYKTLRPIFKEGDEIKEIGTEHELSTIKKVDEDNICYLIHSPEAEEQIPGQWIIKFEDQYLYEKI